MSKSDYEITRIFKRELNGRLPDYMIPRKFIFVEQFPMTNNGKADRRKLSEGLNDSITSFLYFGILLIYIVIPAIIVGFFKRISKIWLVLATS